MDAPQDKLSRATSLGVRDFPEYIRNNCFQRAHAFRGYVGRVQDCQLLNRDASIHARLEHLRELGSKT